MEATIQPHHCCCKSCASRKTLSYAYTQEVIVIWFSHRKTIFSSQTGRHCPPVTRRNTLSFMSTQEDIVICFHAGEDFHSVTRGRQHHLPGYTLEDNVILLCTLLHARDRFMNELFHNGVPGLSSTPEIPRVHQVDSVNQPVCHLRHVASR